MVIAHSNLYWARAAYPNGTGVLVLGGSSGRVDVERANMLASQGVTALALRWFGGEAQPSVPCETPLETFAEAIGMMTVECQHLVLLGSSYGAEAALLTASMDGRVDAAIAMAPTDFVWQGGAWGRVGARGRRTQPREASGRRQGSLSPSYRSTWRGGLSHQGPHLRPMRRLEGAPRPTRTSGIWARHGNTARAAAIQEAAGRSIGVQRLSMGMTWRRSA
jgi:pimeloyl-ACP methyl ester carboxylesterase